MFMSKSGDFLLNSASPAPEGAVLSRDNGAPAAAHEVVLDAAALNNLRDLDPTGQAGLMVRVVQAFDTSTQRLIPLLHTATAAGDMPGVRHVAHTLKSSSASLGALELSRQCAVLEAQARESRAEGLADRVALLTAEVDAARQALHRLVGLPQ